MNNKKLPSEKHESNYIDKIIKENSESLAPFIIKRIFNLQIDRMENLPAIRQQVTIEKEPDFLRLIYNKDYPDGAVVQLEFETGDTKQMVKRMLIYLSLLYNTTGKPVLQYVLFLGKGKAKMPTRIEFDGIDYYFTLINIEDFSYLDFIESSQPEEVILSLLANHDEISDDELLDMILGRFVELRSDEVSTKKFLGTCKE